MTETLKRRGVEYSEETHDGARQCVSLKSDALPGATIAVLRCNISVGHALCFNTAFTAAARGADDVSRGISHGEQQATDQQGD